MMEKIGAPQTYLGLKNMIKEVDEDNDGKISFREVGFLITALFLMLFCAYRLCFNILCLVLSLC